MSKDAGNLSEALPEEEWRDTGTRAYRRFFVGKRATRLELATLSLGS
jgi:hypothetical protein